MVNGLIQEKIQEERFLRNEQGSIVTTIACFTFSSSWGPSIWISFCRLARSTQRSVLELEQPPLNTKCKFGNALKWKEENINCCSKGKYVVHPLLPLSPDIKDVFSTPSFLKRQRSNMAHLR